MKTLFCLFFFATTAAVADPSPWIGKVIPRMDLRTEETLTDVTITDVTAEGITVKTGEKTRWISRYALRAEAAETLGFGAAGSARIDNGFFRMVKLLKSGNAIVTKQPLTTAQSGSLARLMSEISDSRPEPESEGPTYFMLGKLENTVVDGEKFQAKYVVTDDTKEVPMVTGASTTMRVVHLLKDFRE